MANIGTGRGKEPVRGLDPLQRRQGRGLGLGVVGSGQVVALFGIENGVTREEGDFPLGLLSLLVGLGAGDAIGINDKLPCLKVSQSGQA